MPLRAFSRTGMPLPRNRSAVDGRWSNLPRRARPTEVGSGRDVDGGVGVGGVTVELADQIDRQCGDGNPGSSTIAPGRRRTVRGCPPGTPTSSGLPAARPSSSCAPIFASVGAASSLKSTPSLWAGRRTTPVRPRSRARSRCRAPGPAAAQPRKSSMVSANSAMSPTWMAPVSAQNAAAIRRVAGQRAGCAATIARPRGVADRQDHHRMSAWPPGAGLTATGPPPAASPAAARSGGVRVGEDVLDVVGGVGHQFLTRRHGQPEAETAARPQHGGERRAEWVTSETPPAGSGSGSGSPAPRSPVALLTKPMQPAPHRHPRVAGGLDHRLAQRPAVGGAEDHRRARTDGPQPLSVRPAVRRPARPEQHQVHLFVEGRQRWGRGFVDVLVARIDQVHAPELRRPR